LLTLEITLSRNFLVHTTEFNHYLGYLDSQKEELWKLEKLLEAKIVIKREKMIIEEMTKSPAVKLQSPPKLTDVKFGQSSYVGLDIVCPKHRILKATKDLSEFLQKNILTETINATAHQIKAIKKEAQNISQNNFVSMCFHSTWTTNSVEIQGRKERVCEAMKIVKKILDSLQAFQFQLKDDYAKKLMLGPKGQILTEIRAKSKANVHIDLYNHVTITGSEEAILSARSLIKKALDVRYNNRK